MSSTVTRLLLLVFAPLVFGHPAQVTHPNEYTDPKDDIYNPLRYIASNVLTSIALALYLITTLSLFFNMWRKGGKYMLCMAIGGATYCLGLAMRYPLHSNPDSSGVYIVEYLFVVLSPCAFIAGVYILLGRLARELRMGQYLLVKPHKLTKVFIGSDISTFLIQAAGGGLSTSLNMTSRNIGHKIFLVGLALQLASFAIFTFLFIVWASKVHKHSPSTWFRDRTAGKPWHRDWRALAAAILLSCAGILIRSFFRVIENSEGYQGYLTTHEGYFYTLDSLPLWIAISVYVPLWPARFISNDLPTEDQPDVESQPSHHEMEESKVIPGLSEQSTGGPDKPETLVGSEEEHKA